MTKTNTGAGNRPQTIYRTAHDKDNPYVCINRDLAQSDTLSFAALGMLTYILSKPDDWQITLTDLARANKSGRDAARAILDELIEAGYISKSKSQRRVSGRFSNYQYTVWEKPSTVTPSTGQPSTENPTVQSKESQSTEKQNNHQQNNQSVCQSVLITTTTNPPPPEPTTTDNNQNLIDLFVVEIGRPPTDEENYLLSKRPLEWWQDAFDNKTKAIRYPIGFMQACINRNPKIITPVFENHTLSGEWADIVKT